MEKAAKRYTLNLEECCALFRERGIPMDKRRLADGIKKGVYPGRVFNTGKTGRASYEIWTVDVIAFLDSKRPACAPKMDIDELRKEVNNG